MAHDKNEMIRDAVRKAWTRPAVRRLEAGAAESGIGDVTDNSSPQES